ncbi:MAG: hypothetical protein Q4Q58_05995 [Thermoplasmata archaeon]|nr:hypothetical protein [Thermoplasmata archaeon]
MSERKILFVTEGSRSEPRFLTKMLRELFGSDAPTVVSYKASIHELLDSAFVDDEIDEYLSIKSILRERADSKEREILQQRFNDVFLIFDLDPQHQKFKADRLRKALEFFNDSTTVGKLYINYPMFESYRHMKHPYEEEYLTRTVSTKGLSGYKGLSSSEGCVELQDVGKMDESAFRMIVEMNVRKAHSIITGNTEIPSVDEYLSWTGSGLYGKQCEIMDSREEVYVLFTMAFYPIDYAPSKFLKA